jgi:hypothetical protein
MDSKGATVASKPDWIGAWVDAEFFRPSVVRKILSLGDFCTWPDGNEADSEEMMKSIERLGGFYVTGKQAAKDDQHGVWFGRASGPNTVELMIPWKFIHSLMVGSAEQMKKFGFKEVIQ